MSIASCLVDRWTEENNTIITKWKECERCYQGNRSVQMQYYTESLKLLRKIQGIPPDFKNLEVELTVAYNTFLFSLRYCERNEAKELLTQCLNRLTEAVGCQVDSSEPGDVWLSVLRTVSDPVSVSSVHRLLLVQWALWLPGHQFERIHQLLVQVNHTGAEMTSSLSDLLAETGDLGLSVEQSPALQVAMVAKELKDLLHICTVIARGIEQIKEGKHSEALVGFERAKALSTPRVLLAQTHNLAGRCFASLGLPQSALRSYRQALEVDFGCLSSLHHSAVLYAELGNSQAQMEALRLLHSAVMLQSGDRPDPVSGSLVSPAVLLGTEHTAFISAVPSPPVILYTLAHACVLNRRISDGAEFYLDLLASLQSDNIPFVSETSTDFPRIPELYLEVAFTLLRAGRFWDAVAVCDEIITRTADLIPERMTLDLPLTCYRLPSDAASATLTDKGPESVMEKLDCVVWTGAAHFLQGHAYWQLMDTKEAITSFTRSVGVLVKVCISQRGGVCGQGRGEAGHRVLETLKSQALAARAVCFSERGQLKESLRDLQLSLQISPGCRSAELWRVEVLWRLERREEAQACWRAARSSTETPSLEDLPLYLQGFYSDSLSLDHNNLEKKMEKFIQSGHKT
ncbi:Fanconi anemia group G protein [Chanos chanos]|uniref:Fanconi anemia group G protein n=1 Tax=Chanos chanos TaxID=29144 RepID=A0A6J2UTZ2_CHACN|nr:Fanconi anemia group G protein [Chanos chanos]